MNARRVAAVTRRIIHQFRHDHRSLALLFVAPIAIIALLGWVVGGGNATFARVAIVNESSFPTAGTIASQLTTALQKSPDAVQVVANVADDAAARQLLRDKKVDLVVVIPPDFSVENRKIELLTLGINPAAEAGAIPAVQKALIAAIGQAVPSGLQVPTLQHTTVYGSAGASEVDTLAPVFVGFFAYFFVFILTGISFLRERVGGTLERLLATPVTRGEIVLGYSLGFGLFATIQVALVLAIVLGQIRTPAIGPIPELAIGLGVHIAGNPLLAYFLVLVLGLGAVSLGIFLSTFARTELQILQFIPLVIVPQGLLGGIFWTVDQLPDFLQPIARVLPVTYAIEGLRQVMIAGEGLASSTVLLDLGVLVAVAAVFIALASATIRREVA